MSLNARVSCALKRPSPMHGASCELLTVRAGMARTMRERRMATWTGNARCPQRCWWRQLKSPGPYCKSKASLAELVRGIR